MCWLVYPSGRDLWSAGSAFVGNLKKICVNCNMSVDLPYIVKDSNAIKTKHKIKITLKAALTLPEKTQNNLQEK